MDRPSRDDVERVSAAIKSEPVSWRPVTRGGQTAASRWVTTLSDGSTRFVKIAHTDDTAAWIRDEHLFYALAGRRPYLPSFMGWHDDGERPVLVLEDLSGAAWPPPWTRAGVEAVIRCLHEVAESEPPPGLPDARNSQFALDAWPDVAADPSPFLSLGLCSPAWLERHLPALSEASARAVFDGDDLLHFDVRSDNLCLLDGRARLIDWNFACIGNPVFDVAAWLPSLHAEGEPPPERILDTTDEVAAIASLLAGNFGWRGAMPDIADAPHVRPLQRKQAASSLPWAARALGLPPP
ncbi:MAG: aminoglycoside phosphotransferase family protein [Actinomycetota bacterium]|nr:aminoglycoside phosphotransferase family protein [Actinomycetota bacterium]MDH5312972.1 aminoglycoside phosphotransferase family protein [Actinomycetota bacterium]